MPVSQEPIVSFYRPSPGAVSEQTNQIEIVDSTKTVNHGVPSQGLPSSRQDSLAPAAPLEMIRILHQPPQRGLQLSSIFSPFDPQVATLT